MLELSIREAAAAMQARIHDCRGDDPILDRPFPPVSIDSRTLRTGESYFAIVGEHHDGHSFVPQALAAGASALVVEHCDGADLPGDLPVLTVEDTTRALQDLARHLRKIWDGKVIAVTGSMGKTTTREFTARLLSGRFRVLQPQGNLNNHIGLPLSLSRLDRKHDAAVVELGMNHAGEITLLGDICKPDIALITNVAPVHLEFFESVDDIARAKGEILENLQSNGCFAFNADDARCRALARGFQGRRASFGFGPESDYRVTAWTIENLSGMSFTLAGPDLRVSGRLAAIGKHLLYDAAAAIAVAALFDLPQEEISRGLSRLLSLQGRGRLLVRGPHTIWDDSYNSNPRAVDSVLETLSALKSVSRKVLVLGDMLELGPTGPELHRRTGRHAAAVADLLVTVGRLSEHLREGAIEAGLPAASTLHFQCSEEAAEALPPLLRDGDLIVIKASRGVHLDRIVDVLGGGAP